MLNSLTRARGGRDAERDEHAAWTNKERRRLKESVDALLKMRDDAEACRHERKLKVNSLK